MAIENKTTLNTRIAAQKTSARELRQRVASAWTLARTMLPSAPEAVQLKFAKTLLQNNTTVLKFALRQTAINSMNTKLAEQLKDIHKVELNDLLEDPSLLNKERKSVAAELNGEAKTAADDRKDAGPQPNEYKDDGRKEPEGLEASKSEKRPEGTINMSEDVKMAAAKKACKGKGCAGCISCKKAADEPNPEEAPKEEPKSEEVSKEEPKSEEAPKDGEFPAAEPTEEPKKEDEPTFDPDKQEVKDAIEDVQDDIDHLTDALDLSDITDENDNIDDLLSNEETVEGDEDDLALDGFDEEQTGLDEEALGNDEFADGEQELDFSSMFGDENMDSKVSSLANEDSVEAAFDGDGFEGIEGEDEGMFSFNPSEAASLEGLLDQEEQISSPADMFSVSEEAGDPLAAMFASVKQAAGDDVVTPGTLADHFETGIKGSDDRDSETDHEGDLLAEVADRIKVRDFDEHRDQVSTLKPAEKTAGVKPGAKRAGIRTLSPSRQVASRLPSGKSLASLIFLDE
jgi:hypothetical protein